MGGWKEREKEGERKGTPIDYKKLKSYIKPLQSMNCISSKYTVSTNTHTHTRKAKESH